VLRHIQVQNFAIVEAMDLDFRDRMTVFTGETGAGKSILIDALGLCLGDRAQSGMVRAGCERASVTAVFDIGHLPHLAQLLTEKGVDVVDGECIIKRQVDVEGRSRGFINGAPVPAQLLGEIGDSLVDIHGQHAHQSLLKREIQRELLDGFAGHDDTLAAVVKAYEHWKELTGELSRLGAAVAEDREARIDLLRYQLQEIDALRFSPDELPVLEQEHARLSNLTRIIAGCQQAFHLLEESETSVEMLLKRATREVHTLQDIDPHLKPVAEFLENASVQILEANATLRHYLDSLDCDPAKLEQVESRIAALHDLARKHRIPIEDLPSHRETLKTQLDALEHSAERIAELQRLREASLVEYQQAALALHVSRARAGEELAERVSRLMHTLGMPGGRFSIAIETAEGGAPSPTGIDRIEFLVSANPGQPLQPLTKVASGGELSRMSLAIQVIAASDKGVPTLVFDEVDSGIGGAVAEIVGRQLQSLAERRQVLCVTHLPQVASLGHQHLKVTKTADRENTHTRIDYLDGKPRIDEIARMLGGVEISKQTLSHAREMLERGAERRQGTLEL
jgi:DNA repair protein RecN (Recombination protein N)